MDKEKKYINLKEASKISGYSSDYIGSLIRGGKLDGKQIFSNPVWVTTEGALKGFLEKRDAQKRYISKDKNVGEKLLKSANNLKNWSLNQATPIKIVEKFLYLIFISSLVFLISLFYLFSVMNEKNIESRSFSSKNESY